MTGTGPGAVDEPRDWRRGLLIAAPWALAAVLGLVGVAAAWNAPGVASEPGTATTGAPEAEAPTPGPASTAPHAADGPASIGPEPLSLPDEVELAVLGAARTAMGVAGLAAADGSGAGDRWPVDARVVTLHEVTAEHAVAVVHGLVLEHRDDSWHGPHPQAVAVLLRTAPTPVAVGAAWPLPPPTAPTTEPALRPLADPDPSIVAALADGGWTVEEVSAVDTTDDALLRVALRAAPPGSTRADDHVVWLLDAPGGPRLLPLTTHPDDEELP